MTTAPARWHAQRHSSVDCSWSMPAMIVSFLIGEPASSLSMREELPSRTSICRGLSMAAVGWMRKSGTPSVGLKQG